MTEPTKQKSIPAKKLKKLGTQAPTFQMPVTIPTLDGSKVEITLTCNAMRKTEWAKVRDDRHREALQAVMEPEGTDAAAEEAPVGAVQQALENLDKKGFEATVRDGLIRDAETIMAFATGWDLEDDFTVENLQALDDEFGGSLVAIVTRYDVAIYQGRVGNS